VRPILFHIGSLPIRSYGLMMAIAFLVGIWVARRRAVARGYDPDVIIDLSVVVIIVSILGARLAYVLVRWPHYVNDIAGIFRIWEGGLALYGGVIAGTVAGLWFFHRRGINIWAGADIVAPSLALGVAIGRIGCFLNGCCFGNACEAPWGVVFPPDSLAGMTSPGVHVHPTELYESALALLIFAILIAVDRRRHFDGFLLWLFVLLLAVARFFIDPLRHYDTESIALSLGSFQMTNNQAVGIGLVVVAVLFMIRLSRRSRLAGPHSAPPK
jgi:phosphatidylglycerol---prolipoprotein diacylglyceryl transferase